MSIFSINSLLNYDIFFYLLLFLAVSSFWLAPARFASIPKPSGLPVPDLVVKIEFFGKSFDFQKEYGLENREREVYELLGKINWRDHFPILGSFDLRGVKRICRGFVGKVNAFVGKIIQEHRVKRDSAIVADQRRVDFVDVLLDLEKDNTLSDSDITLVLWEMICKGTDASTVLLEWILARTIQLKTQTEIQKLTRPGRPVSASAIPNLPYLQAIIKETLRVHPPGPLLSWGRLAIRETNVGAHVVTAGTITMVNMWAIKHSGEVWPEVEKFRAERFKEEEGKLNIVLGSEMRMAGFGGGRRVCPGKANVQLWVAQFLQKLTWLPAPSPTFDLSVSDSLDLKHPLPCKPFSRVC